MKNRVIAVVMVLVVAIAGCSSPEPASDVAMIRPQDTKYNPAIIRRITPVDTLTAQARAEVDSLKHLRVIRINSVP